MKLYLLFDIDGTLINTGGAGLRAMKNAAAKCLGDERLLEGCSFAGKTDRQIIHGLIRRADIQNNADQKALTMSASYIKMLGENLAGAKNFFVYPHAEHILQLFSRDPNLELALLTGNLEQGARLKLEHASLWNYFGWGVYGDVSEDRNDLARKALDIITKKDGETDPRRIVVIGDTVNDIRCGQAIGATTIAYSAGFQPPEKLLPANPDHCTDNFTDIPAIIAQLYERLQQSSST
jgi:phosphoglycolate phosphatase-like HAD superfamily hydrolase